MLPHHSDKMAFPGEIWLIIWKTLEARPRLSDIWVTASYWSAPSEERAQDRKPPHYTTEVEPSRWPVSPSFELHCTAVHWTVPSAHEKKLEQNK